MVAAFLILVLHSVATDAYDDDDVKGVTYTSEAGTYAAGHAMYSVYYSDGSILLNFAFPGSGSEEGHARAVAIYQGDSLLRYIYPVSMNDGYRVSLGSAVGDGLYQLYVSYNDQDVTTKFVVMSALFVGDVEKMTFVQPDEGSYTITSPIDSSGSVDTSYLYIPSGSILSLLGEDLVIRYGSDIISKLTPTPPEGATIEGWYASGSKIVVDTPMTSDTTIMVKWTSGTEYTYTLSYDANGGSGAPSEQTYTGPEESHAFTIPSDSPTRSGYTFLGWSTSSTATSPSYQPGGTITIQSSAPTQTLYAVWYKDSPTPTTYTYTLSYDANGGQGAPKTEAKTTSSISWTFTVSSGTPTWSDHTFLGWADSATAKSPSYQPGSNITLTFSSPSKTIYAVWSSSPIIPDVDDFYIEVDTIYIPAGKSWTIPCVIKPAEAAPGIVWESSDDNIATVSGGKVTAVSEGKVTITAYDKDGEELGSVAIEVVSSSERTVEEEIETSEGGSVEITYEFDDEGNRVLVNPITIYPGELKRVTDDQTIIAWGYIEALRTSGVDPHVIIPTDEQSVGVPKELLEVIVDNDGSLTVIEGDVTLFFSAEVLRSIGYTDDLEFCVVPVEISGEGSDIDFPDLPNAKIYDLYILSNGERVTRTFSSEVVVTMEYQLKEGQELSRLHVWYIDVDPIQAVDFKYIEGTGVQFGVLHFSHYAISYDDSVPTPCDHCIWCWILILAAVILIIFLIWFFLWKRFKLTLINEGGRIVSVPEDWKRESDSSISIRMRRKQEIVIPKIEAESPEGPYGMRIIGWDPVPPKRIAGSLELRAVWSDAPMERIGPSDTGGEE